MGKKILVVTGSPRAKGNSNTLVTAFVGGAMAAGNEVEVFDAAKAKMDGCHADKSCAKTGRCGLKDDGQKVNDLMRWADVLVLASPVYWKGFTSQIKVVIDHFYQYAFPKGRSEMTVKEIGLIATANSQDPEIFDSMLGEYQLVAELLSIEDKFHLLCNGLDGADAVQEHADYIAAAVKYGMDI